MNASVQSMASMVVGDITVSDAGSMLVLSGPTELKLRVALAEIEPGGYRPLAPPGRVGTRWMTTVAKPLTAEGGTTRQRLTDTSATMASAADLAKPPGAKRGRGLPRRAPFPRTQPQQVPARPRTERLQAFLQAALPSAR
jgi:hypothetical protein